MFDCVLPTRSGRNGQAFTREGALNLRNARFAEDESPLEADCPCPACMRFSRAYLHHVVKANEIIASMLITWHNLVHYQRLMVDLRRAIAAGTLMEFVAILTFPRFRGDQAHGEEEEVVGAPNPR
jgi:queuine tRNA-ribosyltransferase